MIQVLIVIYGAPCRHLGQDLKIKGHWNTDKEFLSPIYTHVMQPYEDFNIKISVLEKPAIQ